MWCKVVIKLQVLEMKSVACTAVRSRVKCGYAAATARAMRCTGMVPQVIGTASWQGELGGKGGAGSHVTCLAYYWYPPSSKTFMYTNCIEVPWASAPARTPGPWPPGASGWSRSAAAWTRCSSCAARACASRSWASAPLHTSAGCSQGPRSDVQKEIRHQHGPQMQEVVSRYHGGVGLRASAFIPELVNCDKIMNMHSTQ